MKKNLLFLTSLTILTLLTSMPVLAEVEPTAVETTIAAEPTKNPLITVTPKPTVRDGLEKSNIKRQAAEEKRTELKNEAITTRRRTFSGTVVSINLPGSSFMATREGKSITVNVLPTTRLVRRYFGKSTLAEFSVGDKVNVIGKFTDTTMTAINADFVKNNSIAKRFGAFVGTVSNLSGSTFDLTTPARGIMHVTVSSTTKFVNRKEQPITLADLKNGHRVRVKGMWDSVNRTITEVGQVKDYSIPTPTVKPTGAVEPTEKPETTGVPSVTVSPTTGPTATPILTPSPTPTPSI